MIAEAIRTPELWKPTYQEFWTWTMPPKSLGGHDSIQKAVVRVGPNDLLAPDPG
jgi:hypothetical protein